MRFNRFSEFINEGKYDRISGEVVDKIWVAIKDSVNHDIGVNFIYDIGKFTTRNIKFRTILNIKRDIVDNTDGFLLDGGIYENTSEMEIDVIIDPLKEPNCYSNLNSMLQDIVRHEIEHLLQGGDNIDKGRAKITSSRDRNRIIKRGGLYKYFLLEDEIPAMVNGMYRKAKTDKKPITNIFNEYLDKYVKSEHISTNEKDIVLKKWIEYVNKNLPNAKMDLL